VRRCEAARVRLVALGDADYPPLLSRITDPPPMLWVRGTLPDPARPSVAIVGSRQATGASLALARAMGRDLARAGVTVVSGLALGIDGEAHRGALEGRGCTVGVLGTGLGRIYPAAHERLGEQVVAEKGALVSEFPLQEPAHPWNFPRRNRVIAGWSLGTVVVEAAARSGALVTARVALEEGREVMAVPGHPATPTAEGTNGLIRDGAALVRGAADVVLELGLEPLPAAAAAGEPLLEALAGEVPLSLDELQARSGLPVPELLQRLSALELEQRVQRLPGALFVRGN